MSDYIKREDAKTAIREHFNSLADRVEINTVINMMPSIDIVRCKECKWADWYKTADGEQFCYCMETGSGGRIADDYCSYGEERASRC